MTPQQQAELLRRLRAERQLSDDIELAGGLLAALILTGLFLWVAFNQ